MSQLEVEAVSALEPLRQEWTELAACSRSVSNTWEWQSTNWDHFGQDRQLTVTTVRSRTGSSASCRSTAGGHARCGSSGSSGMRPATSWGRSAPRPIGP